MITQSASEFALHVRAVLGLPIEYVTYGQEQVLHIKQVETV